MIVGIVIAVIVVLLVLWAVGSYNSLVALRNRVANGWAQIDVQLKQRADLVPNLVETVKGYAAHESEVFTQVTEARAGAVAAASDPKAGAAERATAENKLSRALVNLQATAEAYPQLQANQNFMDLQNQLSQLEQKIAYARQFYNDGAQVQHRHRNGAVQHHRRTVPFHPGPVLRGGRAVAPGAAGQLLQVSGRSRRRRTG